MAATTPETPPSPAAGPPIPGPRYLPRLVQSAIWITNPLGYANWVRNRYGPVAYMKDVLLGDMAYVSDPKLIGQIFKGDPTQMHAGEVNAVLEPIVGVNSVLLLDDDRHMRMRKLLMPPFHGESIRHYGELIDEVARAEIERWPIGEPFALRNATQVITLNVILRAIFGIEEPRRQAELSALMPDLFDLGATAMFERLRVDLGPRSPWGRFLRARKRLDEIIYDEIAHRRSQVGDSTDPAGTDICSLLLAARDEDGRPLTDKELRDELVTTLVAGHETTATALAWAFERLLRNPDKLLRLRQEVDAGEDENYLEAVCKETLRVRPVVMDVGRRLTRPFELGGYTIPKGYALMPAIAAVHLNPDVYDEPERFRPERFLDGAPEPNSWIPFGGGVRRCIGAAFAQFEMKLVLKQIVESVELRATDQKPERARFRGVTLVPSKGARVVVTARREAPRVQRELAGAA